MTLRQRIAKSFEFILKSLSVFWDWLTLPNRSITDVGKQRQARLLAGLLVAITLLLILGIISTAAVQGDITGLLDQVILIVCLIVAYALSRTERVDLGSIIFVLAIIITPIFGNLQNAQNIPISVYSFVPLGLILGSALLSTRGMWFLTIFISTIILFLPQFAPQVTAVQAGTLFGNVFSLGVILTILTAYRNSTEQLRLRQVEIVNRELRELGETLEQRVAERTHAAESARAESESARAATESAQRKLEVQFWLVNGQTQLADAMRGEQDIAQLAESVVSQICQYTGAQAGILYLLKEKTLTLAGRYALAERPGFSGKFQLGEGLVGQAAVDGKVMVLDDIPSDTVTISTGLVDVKPRQIIVAPFRANGEVAGVIELATLSAFSQSHLELWNRTSESIGVAFRTAQTRQRLAELLMESQAQSEELQAQEEELRAANEELHAQAENLKAAREIKARKDEA